MKILYISSILLKMLFLCLFLSCNNDSLDINSETSSFVYMTRDEINYRLDTIGAKYAETIKLTENTNPKNVTEDFFKWVEFSCIKKNRKKIYINDEMIDNVPISTIGTYAAPVENISYTGTFSAECHLYDGCVVNVNCIWHSNSINSDYVEFSAPDEYFLTGTGYGIFTGPVYNPTFTYWFTLEGIKFEGVYMGGGMFGETE